MGLARLRVERVSPHTAGVVRQQVNGHRRLRRRRAHAVDVVARRDERVEVARGERTPLGELEGAVPLRVDLLVLAAAVEADEAPRQMVVDRRLRGGRHDEREERERAVVGAVEKPLADPATHAAVLCRLRVLRRKPAAVREQVGEARPDGVDRFLR